MRFFKILKKYKWYFLLVICLLALSLGTVVYADKISDIQNDISDIKSQQSEATRKMQEAEDNIARYQNEISSLEGNIAEYAKDIDSLNGRLGTVNEEVKQLEDDLQNAAAEARAAPDAGASRRGTVRKIRKKRPPDFRRSFSVKKRRENLSRR